MRPPKDLDPDAGEDARFGYELRKARNAAKLTLGQMGAKVGFHANTIGAVERAERRPFDELAKKTEEALGLQPGSLAQYLPDDRRPWVYKSMLPPSWLEIEAGATELWIFTPTMVPGLLQTEGYTRAVMLGAPRPDPAQVEERVAARMRRQEILNSPDAPMVWAVLDESILYRLVGSEEITRAQFAHLAGLADTENVSIQILPLDAMSTTGLLGGFTIAHSPERPDAAFVDGPVTGKMWDTPAEVETLRLRYQKCRQEAEPKRRSLEMIKERLAAQWTKQ
ncbi:Scr1 family TA system antitoxin-like transcriptional regulator [Nonomuraea fuscirosea]|uniref:helix-turn-helix domain-containing protein n=1 Tax=Nonomuraea fuscirosea TaxID=1291556 RepID=UPI00346BA341